MKLVRFVVGSSREQIQTMHVVGSESRVRHGIASFLAESLVGSPLDSSTSSTLKWIAVEAHRAKVLDVMGMWIVDGGTNVFCRPG